jgi:hypothetical protein
MCHAGKELQAKEEKDLRGTAYISKSFEVRRSVVEPKLFLSAPATRSRTSELRLRPQFVISARAPGGHLISAFGSQLHNTGKK